MPESRLTPRGRQIANLAPWLERRRMLSARIAAAVARAPGPAVGGPPLFAAGGQGAGGAGGLAAGGLVPPVGGGSSAPTRRFLAPVTVVRPAAAPVASVA